MQKKNLKGENNKDIFLFKATTLYPGGIRSHDP
jgi:hypothetical protein